MRPLEEILAMWEELTAAMRAAYRPYNLQLFELLGRCCGDYPRCLNEYKCFMFVFCKRSLVQDSFSSAPLAAT
jgi:hypothetical protein